MSLLEQDLKIVKREYTLPPEWKICKYCKVPFQSSCFEDCCNRCKNFDIIKQNLIPKIMLRFIILCIINALIYFFLILWVSKFTKDKMVMSFILLIPSIIVGHLLLKSTKGLLNE